MMISIQNRNNNYTDVNDQFNDFYYRLESFALIKKLNKKAVNLKAKPWATKEILKLIKIRNKYFERKKR